MEYVILAVYWLLLIGSVLTIPFSLPGTFLIVVLNIIFQLIDTVPGINWNIVGILFTIAVALELFEFLITTWSSKKFGASNPGTVAAIFGSILGAIVGTGMIPIIGSLIGAFIGAFLGAFIVEYLTKNDIRNAINSGIGALTGAVGGKITKIIGGIAMLILIGMS